ncbi:unnamed protein product [Phyllotreta striolata]|uniref:Major facilitator superfamily domain-containing protein 12 n=1 Tax=Phyllotreta striolata TaxID=444603 RepID=A0A9N9THN1_PHYSR|nr:unnamed protein product [Phyllotreta striolata]
MDAEIPPKLLCLSLQKISYGLGHIFNDLCAAMWFSYTLFYLQVVLNMGAATAGLLLMIGYKNNMYFHSMPQLDSCKLFLGQVVDSLATPLVGFCIDYVQHRRLWHLTGTFAVALGFYLIFSLKPSSFDVSTIVYYISTISLFQIGWATVQISHLSIIPEISISHKHSSDLTAIRYIASVCCNICVYLVTLAVLKSDGTNEDIGPGDFYKFKAIALIIMFIGLMASMLFYCGLLAKYEDQPEMEPLLNNGEIKDLNKQNSRHFLRFSLTYCVSIMYMCSRLFTTLNLIYIPLYIDERGQLNNIEKDSLRQTIASIPLTSYIASFLTSILLKFRIGFVTDQMTYLIGSIVGIVASIWIGAGISSRTDSELYTIAALLGITGSTTMVSSLCLTASFVKINSLGGAQVYSIVTFTDKLISGSIVLVVQHMQCTPKDSCPYFYKNVMSYISASVSVIAMSALIFLHIQTKHSKKTMVIS